MGDKSERIILGSTLFIHQPICAQLTIEKQTFKIKILDKTFVLSCFRVRKVGWGYILIS